MRSPTRYREISSTARRSVLAMCDNELGVTRRRTLADSQVDGTQRCSCLFAPPNRWPAIQHPDTSRTHHPPIQAELERLRELVRGAKMDAENDINTMLSMISQMMLHHAQTHAAPQAAQQTPAATRSPPQGALALGTSLPSAPATGAEGINRPRQF